jgi:hypothetical protein
MLYKSREIAESLLSRDPALEDPAHAPLKAWLREKEAMQAVAD